MKLYVNAFWDGFLDQMNPVHIGFFLDLFKGVFGSDIQLCSQIMESDILLESIFGSSVLGHKGWKYSFLFSGESRLVPWYKQYTCVLWGERNHDNVVNVPLFIPFLHCNGLDVSVGSSVVPPKNVCAVLSNGGGRERNLFMERLERLIQIDYAGSYRTNVPIIEEPYHTEGFRRAISQYKFIITMENSREDTYITEKITHGFVCGTIPIYWGSQRIGDYFNSERFINVDSVDDETVSNVAERIQYLCSHPEEYVKMVNGPVYSNERTIAMIARDIRGLIFRSNVFPLVSQIYIVANPDFEPERCSRLMDLFYNKLGISGDQVSFISPTYKHMITDEMMRQNVVSPIIQRLRTLPMKKSEVSLYLNYKAVLESIERNYKDGMFLIFESDVFLVEQNLSLFCGFLEYINNKRGLWDVIHIGWSEIAETFGIPAINGKTPYRDFLPSHLQTSGFIEDITNNQDPVRLIRKYHTRCTDSFVWNYSGVIKFLEYMNKEPCNTPLDYYMINKLETDADFKHYWTSETFFIQGSNHGLDKSTIQNDIV
jgi:hypothetical protein